MKILLIGGGGREHALAWRIAQCSEPTELHCAPGNPGMEGLSLASGGEVMCHAVPVGEHNSLIALAQAKSIDLVIIGPEAPLEEGLADRLKARGFAVFGPSAVAARLETSKAFAKEFMVEADIPTARHASFTEIEPAKAFLDEMTPPYVLKASGLAAGKGVVIAQTREEAEAELEAMMGGKFGDAGAQIVIEEFMDGEEASIFAISDGVGFVLLPAIQDHKRVGEGDTGPNTGGMGTYGPASIVTPIIMDQIRHRIVAPTLTAMQERGTPYVGVLYVGVMLTADGPKVVEYNVRFGDPETQVLMHLLGNGFANGLMSAASGRLNGEAFAPRNDVGQAVCVTYAAQGYPGSVEKGSRIGALEEAQALEGVTIFHAGTRRADAGSIEAAGGRVLSVTACGADLPQAIERAYQGVDAIDWEQGFVRRDIGYRELARLKG
jgi:phosphoribosylamine--glycine ligase